MTDARETAIPTCIRCKQPFTHANVFSPEGWKETEISGMCEMCFDDCTLSLEDEDKEG